MSFQWLVSPEELASQLQGLVAEARELQAVILRNQENLRNVIHRQETIAAELAKRLSGSRLPPSMSTARPAQPPQPAPRTTIRDVAEEVLRQHKRPMTAPEIHAAILRRNIVTGPVKRVYNSLSTDAERFRRLKNARWYLVAKP